MGQWGPAVTASAKAMRIAPGSVRNAGQLLASLAGPWAWAALETFTTRWTEA